MPFLQNFSQETIPNNIQAPPIVLDSKRPYTKLNLSDNRKNNVFSQINVGAQTMKRFLDISNQESSNLESSTKLDTLIRENSLNNHNGNFDIQFPDKITTRPKTMTNYKSLQIFQKPQEPTETYHNPKKYSIRTRKNPDSIDPSYFYEKHKEISKHMKRSVIEILNEKARTRQSIRDSN